MNQNVSLLNPAKWVDNYADALYAYTSARVKDVQQMPDIRDHILVICPVISESIGFFFGPLRRNFIKNSMFYKPIVILSPESFDEKKLRIDSNDLSRS